MATICQILNGSNLTRDAGFQDADSYTFTGGVRKGFDSDLQVITGFVQPGMAFIFVTRTSVTPNETFIVPVRVTTAEAVDTTGTGFIIIALDQTKINDGTSNATDGSGIATVQFVTSLPTDNYIQLATVTAGVITDTRTYAGLTTDTIVPKTASGAISIDGNLIKDGEMDMEELAAAPTTPTTGRWKFYFKSGGAYLIDDAGTEYQLPLTSGAVAAQKAAASAVNGEIFENTDDNNSLYWENQAGTQKRIATTDLTIFPSQANLTQKVYTFLTYEVTYANGTGAIVNKGGGSVRCDAGNNAGAGYASAACDHNISGFGNIGGLSPRFYTSAAFRPNSNQDSFVGIQNPTSFPVNSVLTSHHASFLVDDGNVYASTGDGTTQNLSPVVDTIITDEINNYYIEYDSGVEARFYINGILVFTSSSSLPTILYGAGGGAKNSGATGREIKMSGGILSFNKS